MPDKSPEAAGDARAALLRARLRGGQSGAEKDLPFEAPGTVPAEPVAIGPFQEPLWLDYQLFPERRSTWVVRGYHVVGSLDQQRLREALDRLQWRHWSLTAAVTGSGSLLAVDKPIPLRVWHCAADPWREMATFCREALPGFRLEDGELMAVYVAVGADSFVLVWAIHHILVDLDSLVLLERELDTLYNSPGAQLDAVVSVGAAYALQRRELEQRRPILERFWQQQLADLPPLLPLPWAGAGCGHGRAGDPAAAGKLIRRPLPAGMVERIWRAAADSGSTPYQWLLAGWCVLLAHYWQQCDIHLGAVVSLRTTPAQRRVLGYFQNIVVLRIDLDPCSTFQDVLGVVQGRVAQAMQHRDMPVHELLRSLGGRGTRGPLFSSLFTLIDAAQPGTFLGGNLRQRQSLDYGGAAFDCSCFFLAHPQAPALAIEYNSALYAADDIEKSLEHYYRVLLQCLESCEQRQARDWRRFRLVDDADYRAAEHYRRQLQIEAQSTQIECLHQAFGRKLEECPGRIAVVWSDGVDRLQLSYRQLSQQADAVAGFLATLEPAADAPVALVARWHPSSIAAMLGILRAGCAYLPVDPDYPTARIAHMLRDSGCGIVLSAADTEVPGGPGIRCFPLDTAVAFSAEPSPNQGAKYRRGNPGGLAYVIYTSGSSGPPKGVMVEHRAAVYSTRERSRVYAKWRPDRFLLLSSIAFDSAVAGLWWTLSTGGTLYLTTPSLVRAADRLVALIQQESITHTLCLPSQWRDICRLAPPLGTLRLAIVAGEACDAKVARAHFKAAPRAALFNEYGPTEMTVWSTWHRLVAEQADPVPIGKPLSQTQALILDRWGNLVPDGLAGELCLAGAGIARGYMGSDSSATESGFIDHPLDPASRAYRTGDRVRRDSRGRLYFEGRVDEQVKFRGHRIAIESVEATLRRAGSTALAVLPFNGESLEALLEQLPEAEALAMLARHGATSTG